MWQSLELRTPIMSFCKQRRGRWLIFSVLLVLLIALCGTPRAAPHKPTRTIYLIRHGDYDDSARDNAHAALTALGVAQVRLLAARLRFLPEAPAEIVVSTMTRAKQTAAEIHSALPAVPERQTDLLRECTPPVPPDVKLPASEQKDATACGHRLDQVFSTYFVPAPKSETDILVCHGNVIRYLIARAIGMNPELWIRFSIGHTSISEVQVRTDGTMRVISVGDVGHLPSNLQSGTVANAGLPLEPVFINQTH